VRQALHAGYRGRTLGFLGSPRVNVIEANLALLSLDAR
jgi:K+-transporting ATPase c subunit